MRKFLNNHPEAILVALAVFFVAIIVGFYFWGITTIVVTTNQALNYVPPQADIGFNLDGAKQLDLRGLVK